MDAKLKYKAKKVKYVFFDIDETLRIKETGFMPESIKYVFEALRKKGISTGIASGRAIYGVVEEIRNLHPDIFVTINGACVLDKHGEVVYKDPVDPELVKRYVSWCVENDIAYGFAGAEGAYVSERSARVDDALVPVYGLGIVDPDYHLSHDVFLMWTFHKDNPQLTLPDDLSKELRLVPWHEYSSDVIREGISKASGVAKVLEQERLKPENILVFGDELNDLELFDYAGLSVAMGVSHPKLQEKADFVTKKVEEDGILYALEELGLIEKELHFPQTDIANAAGPVATIKTNHGDLVIKLFPEQAPKTVANFIALAKDGYYDGVIFHRIIKDFMIQGGDPTGTGMGGQSIYGDSFEDEFSMELFNVRGALSMANAGPNTNGSQFFIVQNSNLPYAKKELERGGWPTPIATLYAENGGTPHLDQRHTVFGQLMDEDSYQVLDAIANVETGALDKPVEDVVIEAIEIED